MGFLNIFGIGVVYLICISSFTTADTCVSKTPCSCEFSNGTGIDLTPAVSSEFYTADTYAIKMNGTQYEMSTYYYHPCYDVNINVSQSNPKTTCTSPLSVSPFSMKLILLYSSTPEGSYSIGIGFTKLRQWTYLLPTKHVCREVLGLTCFPIKYALSIFIMKPNVSTLLGT